MENSPNKKKIRESPRQGYKNLQKNKEESNGNQTSGQLTSNKKIKIYSEKHFDQPEPKCKVIDLSPRNSTKQSSDGVHRLIKHVSNFIEKKNPFKEKPKESNEIFVNGTKTFIRNEEFKVVKTTKDFSPRPKIQTKLRSYESQNLKKSRNVFFREQKTNCVDENPKEQELNNNKEESKPEKIFPNITSSENDEPLKRTYLPKRIIPRRSKYREIAIEDTKTTSEDGQIQSKRIGRSEIPLRKNRPDLLKKYTKPVSLLMKNSIEESESVVSVEFYQKKSFSPIEELSLASESQNDGEKPKEISSSETFVTEESMAKDEEEIPEIATQVEGDTGANLQLNRCSKSSDITNLPELFCYEVINTTSGAKKLDLEKLINSPIAILKSATNTYNRLETLHHQNICAKENAFYEKTLGSSSSKVKIPTPKTSFNSLKTKASKKNLSARLSSKGNKPNLKSKAKKEFQAKKRAAEDSKIHNQIFATGKAIGADELPVTKRSIGKNYFEKRNAKLHSKLEEIQKDISLEIKGTTLEFRTKNDVRPSSSSRSTIFYFNSECPQEFEKPDIFSSTTTTSCLESLEDKDKPKQPNTITLDIIEPIGDGNNEVTLYIGVEAKKKTPITPPPTPEDMLEFKLPNLENFLKKDADVEETSKAFVSTAADEDSVADQPPTVTNETPKTKFGLNIKNKKIKNDKITLKEKDNKNSWLETLVVKGTSLKFLDYAHRNCSKKVEADKTRMETKNETISEEKVDKVEVPNNEGDIAKGKMTTNFKKSNEAQYKSLKIQTDQKSIENLAEDQKARKKENENNEQRCNSTSMTSGNDQSKKERPNVSHRNSNRSSSSLKGRPKSEAAGLTLQTVPSKKKLRSDAGDRHIFGPTGHFNSTISFPKQIAKPDAKLRSGLTKSFRETKTIIEKKDVFEETSVIKLKRRNSEPYSFKGFIWKKSELTAPKGNRASVSSMASSLKHLNTDELEDFIFWEAVPQKMTSCWEMSLYHFKRPWSVLSCSVFKDNRQSSTPGLILANLRNGGVFSNRRISFNGKDKVSFPKENPFDVEPSISQKNIDIRNWLAALNFPTPPSTSANRISEGNCCIQPSIAARIMNKNQVSLKRRKVLPGLKFSEEVVERKTEDSRKRFKETRKWNSDEVGGLFELIRRKSGGFVTNQQLHKAHLQNPPQKVMVNYCAEPEPIKNLVLKNVDVISSEDDVKMEVLKTSEATTNFELLAERKKISRFADENDSFSEKEKRETQSSIETSKSRRLDFNIWKYLFLFTVFIVVIYYFFSGDKVCRIESDI